MSMKQLASVARHLGLNTLARWLMDNREAVRAELVELAPASSFRRVGACADAPAPCSPARRAPALPPVGSEWTLHEGGERPRDRVVRVTGYVNAEDPASERDAGAVFSWPVVLFDYLDTGEPGRLYLSVFAGSARPAHAPPEQPALRAALERIADARDVPSVSTSRASFDPADESPDELVRRGLAKWGPPRFASQDGPSLDITPAGLDLYARWTTRAGAPAEAHLDGPFNFLVYDRDPEGWLRTGKNAWRRTLGPNTVSVSGTGSAFGNDQRRATQRWMVAAVSKEGDAVRWHAHAWRDSLADALALARGWHRSTSAPTRDPRRDPERGDTWRTARGEMIVLHADGWTVATSPDPAALSFDWRGKGNTRWPVDAWQQAIEGAAYMGTTAPVPGARSRRA